MSKLIGPVSLRGGGACSHENGCILFETRARVVPSVLFCKHMTSPTAAVQSTVKHDPYRRKQKESIVKIDYVSTSILCVISSGQTLKYGDIQSMSKIRLLIWDDSGCQQNPAWTPLNPSKRLLKQTHFF